MMTMLVRAINVCVDARKYQLLADCCDFLMNSIYSTRYSSTSPSDWAKLLAIHKAEQSQYKKLHLCSYPTYPTAHAQQYVIRTVSISKTFRFEFYFIFRLFCWLRFTLPFRKCISCMLRLLAIAHTHTHVCVCVCICEWEAVKLLRNIRIAMLTF